MQKKTPIFIFVLLLGFACACLIFFTASSYWSASQNTVIVNFQKTSEELKYRTSSQLNRVVNIAANNSLLAAKSPLLQASIENPSAVANLQASWANMFESAKSLSQIRYIDTNGLEVFRSNRTQNGLEWVTGDALQNKRDRDYFIAGMAGSYEIYLSSLDLNNEGGQIEIPYVPTIRGSAKVFRDGLLAGIVVLNFDLTEEFNFLDSQQAILKYWVVNQAGYFIASPDDSEWGWLTGGEEHNASIKFPDFFKDSLNDKAPLDSLNDTLNNTLNEIPPNFYLSTFVLTTELEGVEQGDRVFYLVTQLSDEHAGALQERLIVIAVVAVLSLLLVMLIAIYINNILSAMQKSEELAVELAHKAEQSERSKANFLAQMSHEIRTPMNGMYGLLQMTQGERDYKKINRNLDQAIGSFKALKRIIDDILDFSKIEANKLSLVSQPFRLDTTFREVANVMGRAAYEKDLEMWIDIAPECPREVLGDAIRVNQILFNLANNAIKFTESGEVKLSVSLISETEDSYCLGFSMSDTGVGMSEQEITHVFEAFKQASNTTHSKFGGTGLGLSIVKQLIELMDGDINIIS